jgi:hypothetical protein
VFEVQQPTGVEHVTIEPPPTGEVVGRDGLVYRHGVIAAEEASFVRLSYEKRNASLTASALRQTPGSGSTILAGTDDSYHAVVWSVVATLVLGLGLLLGGWAWLSKRHA